MMVSLTHIPSHAVVIHSPADKTQKHSQIGLVEENTVVSLTVAAYRNTLALTLRNKHTHTHLHELSHTITQIHVISILIFESFCLLHINDYDIEDSGLWYM